MKKSLISKIKDLALGPLKELKRSRGRYLSQKQRAKFLEELAGQKGVSPQLAAQRAAAAEGARYDKNFAQAEFLTDAAVIGGTHAAPIPGASLAAIPYAKLKQRSRLKTKANHYADFPMTKEMKQGLKDTMHMRKTARELSPERKARVLAGLRKEAKHPLHKGDLKKIKRLVYGHMKAINGRRKRVSPYRRLKRGQAKK